MPLSPGVVFQIMTLWDLLLAVCFVMPVSGAIAAAKLIRAGVVGYVLSVLIGLMLGLGCAWIAHKTGASVHNRVKQRDNSVQNRYFRLLYLGAMLWIVFALFLGLWITSPILRALKR